MRFQPWRTFQRVKVKRRSPASNGRFFGSDASFRAVWGQKPGFSSSRRVHGSVLVHDGVVYCVAGRSMWLDAVSWIGYRVGGVDADFSAIEVNGG